MEDFETHVKVDPKVLDETVKSGVEAALLRMTEKKMIAEEKVIVLEAELANKDNRIRELEEMILRLSTGGKVTPMSATHPDADLNERADMTVERDDIGYVGQTFAGVFKNEQQSGLTKNAAVNEIDDDDSFWY